MIKTYFSIEIERNRTDPSTMYCWEQANAVLEQVNAQQQEQCLQLEVMVAQIEKIQALENQLTTIQYN